MKKSMYSKTRITVKLQVVLLHCVAIAVFLLFDGKNVLFSGNARILEYYVAFILFDISYFYSFTYFLIPLFYRLYPDTMRRLLLSVLAMSMYAQLLTFINTILVSLFAGKIQIEISPEDYLAAISRSMFISALAFGFAHLRYSRRKERELADERISKIQAEQKNLELEIALLQSQLNPHLLNNMLTAFHVRLKPIDRQMSGHMLSLASMASYCLKTSKQPGPVSVDQELEILKEHIDMYCWLAREQKLFIDYKVKIDQNSNPMVHPQLMTDLIVNIFKYGNLSSQEKPAIVNVNITSERLEFHSWNLRHPSPSATSHGTGLDSIRKRLDTYYPDRHEFSSSSTETTFEVHLKIDL